MALSPLFNTYSNIKPVMRDMFNCGSNINKSKEVYLLQCQHLAEASKYSECLRQLWDTFSAFNVVRVEDVQHVIKQLVDNLRQDIIDRVSSNRDGVVCPMCFGVLHDAVTFSCAHTYCGNCNDNTVCVMCETNSPVAEHKRNILISSVVKQVWKNECEAVEERNKADELVKASKLQDALMLYDSALQICDTDHVTLSHRSHVRLCLEQPTLAELDARKAVRAAPHWYYGHKCLSKALSIKGQAADACSELLVAACLADKSQLESLCAKLAQYIHRQLTIDKRHNNKSSRSKRPHLHQPWVQIPLDAMAQLGFNSSSSSSMPCETSQPSSREGGGGGGGGGMKHFRKQWMDQCLDKRKPHETIGDDGCAEMQSGSLFLQRVLEKYFESMEYVKEQCGEPTFVPSAPITADEFDCSLCFRMLWQPVSTPCGHTFCKTCLNRSMDHTPYCPLCKTPLKKYLASRRFMSCSFVDTVIQKLFPSAHHTREQQAQAELDQLSLAGLSQEYPMPIFVACIITPFMNCPLHIYEPRYKLMIRRCMESGTREFGMCGPVEPWGYSDYGTTLEIKDIRYLPDGRSILNSIGLRRFKVLKRGDRDGYDIASIEYLKDNPASNLEQTQKYHDKLRKSVELWFTKIQEEAREKIVECCGEMPPVEPSYWTKENGPDWLWWLANVLPLHNLTKQSLLRSTELQERLCILNSNMFKFLASTWTMGITKKKQT